MSVFAAGKRRPLEARRRVLLGPGLTAAFLVLVKTLAGSFATAWTRQFGTSDTDVAGGIAANGAGYVVVGTTNGNLSGQNLGYSDAFIRRYDGAGGIVWTRQFGTELQGHQP